MVQVISKEIVLDLEITGNRLMAKAVGIVEFNIRAISLIPLPFSSVSFCGTTTEKIILGLGEVSIVGDKL